MPKKFPLAATRERLEQHSSAVEVGLLRIRPVDGSDEILLCTGFAVRLSDDPLRYGFVSRGETYDYLPMKVALPGSSRTALPAAAIEIDNKGPEAVDAVRSSIWRASLDIQTVHAARPNEVVDDYPGLEVVDAVWKDDEDLLSIKVGYPSLESTPLVRHRLTVRVSPCLRNMG
ncbi:hypothetical protein ACFOWB_14465 [Chenggangzhangella methanolivorans]|uniref:hypothetical protein n=1 Tax=Chenggangzhangella methanolivorans TaxID=1437009 RepID=UPI00361C4274